MEVKWLRQEFCEVAVEGPDPMKVKFSEVKAQVEEHFVPTQYTQQDISRLVRQAFPSSHNKASGKRRQSYISGIQFIPSLPKDTAAGLDHQLEEEIKPCWRECESLRLSWKTPGRDILHRGLDRTNRD